MKSNSASCYLILILGLSTIAGCRSEVKPIEYINGRWAEDPEIPTTLNIGDRAPSVRTSQWVHGDHMSGFEKGKIHVVEFWATWCGPCLQGMPHLSDLAQKHDDSIRVIGVTRETPRTVEGFLEEHNGSSTWREIIRYNLVSDDANQSTSKSYMEAANESSIPCAFIIGQDGMIDWIGSPFEIDEPLEKVLAGQWDRDKARVAREEKLARQTAFDEAMAKYKEAIEDDDYESALTLLDELTAASDQDFSLYRLMVLGKLERFDDIKTTISEIKKGFWDDPVTLNSVSWLVSDELPEELNAREIAIEFSERAAELTNSQEPPVLDTLARAYYENGQLDKAIEWQSKAAKVAPDSDRIQTSLQKYIRERMRSKK